MLLGVAPICGTVAPLRLLCGVSPPSSAKKALFRMSVGVALLTSPARTGRVSKERISLLFGTCGTSKEIAGASGLQRSRRTTAAAVRRFVSVLEGDGLVQRSGVALRSGHVLLVVI